MSSPPPSIDRIVDLTDDQVGTQPAVTGPGPAYVPTPPSDIISDSTTTGNQYYNAGHGGYYVPTTRDDYPSSYQSDSSNNQYIPATSGGSYVPSDAGYYQSTPAYSAASSSGGGYYSSAPQQHGDWLSSNGDPGAFVGATSADYYYVCDPDLQNPGSSP
jgi:hypothetical protein